MFSLKIGWLGRTTKHHGIPMQDFSGVFLKTIQDKAFLNCMTLWNFPREAGICLCITWHGMIKLTIPTLIHLKTSHTTLDQLKGERNSGGSSTVVCTPDLTSIKVSDSRKWKKIITQVAWMRHRLTVTQEKVKYN